MNELLTGLVPGLPDDLRDRMLDRAEGVPLYAVETVRMLLDRGLLVAGRQRLPGDRCDRAARGAGNAARADRGPPRRARRRGTAPGPVRRGARQDVHETGLAAVSGVAGRSSSRSSPGCSARRCSRSRPTPVARARPVLVPAGHRQAGRLRDDLATGAQGQAPRDRAVPASAGAPRRTRSSRSSPLTTSTPTRRARRSRTPTRIVEAPARCSFAQPNARPRSARTRRRSAPSSAPAS